LSTARSLRLGFAGTPEFAVPALEALGMAHRICAVFTQPDRPSGRGQALHSSPVKTHATLRGFPVYQPASFKSPQTLELLRGLTLDALVVVAYGLILPPAALECPRLGCINIHASLLPRWRGAAPIQRALLAGDATTGVTIMRMDAGLDTGPMLAARSVDIGERDSAKTLQDRLAGLGAELIAETLKALDKGGIREVPQPAQGVTYAEKINKAEARIDWRRDAAQISRQVRALYPWPIAETLLNGAQLRIWDAEVCGMRANQAGQPGESVPPRADAVHGTVLAATEDGIDVACGRGVLRILRLQLAGRKSLCAREFIQGQRLDGARFAQA
jgi:methionyl-tRNA formyltransferase